MPFIATASSRAEPTATEPAGTPITRSRWTCRRFTRRIPLDPPRRPQQQAESSWDGRSRPVLFCAFVETHEESDRRVAGRGTGALPTRLKATGCQCRTLLGKPRRCGPYAAQCPRRRCLPHRVRRGLVLLYDSVSDLEYAHVRMARAWLLLPVPQKCRGDGEPVRPTFLRRVFLATGWPPVIVGCGLAALLAAVLFASFVTVPTGTQSCSTQDC